MNRDTKIILLAILALAVFIVVVGLLASFYFTAPHLNMPRQTIINFEECADAGYPVMETYPRRCTVEGVTFIEEIREAHYCTRESRETDACLAIYNPVCGWFDPTEVQCVRYPCAQTFSNSCIACINRNVLYWTQGECPA